MTHDIRDTKFGTLYKNNRERSDCTKYRGISLLSIVVNMQEKSQKLAERIYPEAQCGFRAGISTFDIIFPLKKLHENCMEQNMPLYLVYVDLTKA